jgi:ATP-dependent helicase/nuclease subunit B
MSRIQLESEGLLEEAESTSQIWDTIVEILDQLAEVLGDEVISDEDFNEILSEGFEEVEIGLIPTNNDQVIFGTMQRTRTGNVRAMFAAGANEGVLPEAGRTESLLSDEEKQIITEKHRRISKTDELRVMEQNLAIYKNMTKAAEKLTVSYAKLDTDGSEIRPSELVENVMKLSSTAVRRDYISSGDTDSLLQTPSAAAGHVTSALRKYLNGESLSDVWKAAALVLDGQRQFDTAKAGLLYSGKAERIDRRQVRELFGRGKSKELVLSASALEKYSRCPFSFLITYGLRPEEERRFEVDMRSIGDIYHECMRRVAYELTSDSMEISDPQSRWMTVSTEECRTMTSHYVDEFSERYREGVFNVTQREAYIRERIKEICFETAWLMIQQVRSGRVKAIYFEQRFALRADALFPPIEIDLGDEGSIFIEGMIDRIDIINGWEDGGVSHNYVRIIDYKSGNEKFNLEEVKTGWRLQLMLYLKGAMGAVEDSRPAGVFYFAVKEPRIDVTDTPSEDVEGTVKSGMLKSVKLDGAVLDNVSVITGMDENISGFSDIIPVRRKKDGTFSGGTLLTDEEFDELIDINDSNLESLAENLVSGCVHIDPKSGKSVSACRYCGYNSICNHE